jgi:hypothetical protein
LVQESSYDECVTTEAYGRAGFDSPIPDESGVARSCDLVPNQIFEIRKSEGGFSQEKSPFSFGDVDNSDSLAIRSNRRSFDFASRSDAEADVSPLDINN